ncbi:MAG: HEPN family nuclease [Methylococcaceae bacterium]
MNYQDLVVDFAKRTAENLETLRQLKQSQPDAEIYEVTQLINSMLGLLVFPKEKDFKFPHIKFKDLDTNGWIIPQPEIGNQVRNLSVFIRYLRNAIAHCNLEFLSGSDNQICGLRVWNKDKNGNITWKATLAITDIEKITNKLLKTILKKEITT